MNQNLVQINDNYGAVSDENGGIKVVSKKNNGCELKDILMKENELEYLNSKLNSVKEELVFNKTNATFGEIMNALIVVQEIVLYFFAKINNLEAKFFVLAFIYIITKGMNLFFFGTRIGRHNKRKKLIATIRDLEEKVPQLEKNLTEMKEKTKYNVEDTTINNLKSTNSISTTYRGLSTNMQSNINEESKKVKILSLTKKI